MITDFKYRTDDLEATIVVAEGTALYQTGGVIVRYMDVGHGESPWLIEERSWSYGNYTRHVRFCGEYGAEFEALLQRVIGKARGERGDGNVYLDLEEVRGTFDAVIVACSFWPILSKHRVLIAYLRVAERHCCDQAYRIWRSACIGDGYFRACIQQVAWPFLGPNPSRADEHALEAASEVVHCEIYRMFRNGTGSSAVSNPELAILTDGFSSRAVEDAIEGAL